MNLTFFNTMDRKREEFQPLVPGRAGMYTCGPTVYNYAHIGNFRAYMFEDLLRRTLEFFGYRVTQVMNLTDVDDKTIRDSQRAGIPLKEFTAKYIKAFFEDLKTLNIEPAEHYPAATEHIPEMIELIRKLMERGIAYQAEDRSVYFSIDRFPDYGKLARIDRSNQLSGVRIRNDEYAKDAVADFALWKAWDEADGAVGWDSPWGRGRPGWHIECSAMSMKYLGDAFDLHTGGIDNMFPHHEDEIAQSESVTGKKWVNYWLHCDHLMVNGEKMSKSLGNFFTLRDLLEKGYRGREIRLVLLSAHYRKKLNFTFEALDQARETLRRFDDFRRRLQELGPEGSATAGEQALLDKFRAEFADGLADDLNISAALAAFHEAQRMLNKHMESGELTRGGAAAALVLFRDFDRVLGYLEMDAAAEAPVPPEVTELVAARQAARRAKNYAEADRCRDALKALGYVVEDIPGGGCRVKLR